MRDHRISPQEWGQWLDRADGAQLIVAGPGTGKTEFLVRRVASIVGSGLARRDEVAVFSFSRRSASDLRRRITESLGQSGMPVESSTFHSLSLRLLEVGSGQRPIPLTTPEHVAVVGDLLRAERPTDWPLIYRGILPSPAFAAEIADFLMRCAERLLSPEDLRQKALERHDWRGIPEFFEKYRQRLLDMERIDYGTLLVSAVDFLRTTRGQQIASGYRFVLVDDYQDTSPAQASIANLLARPNGNLTVAGDPYQSVYSFRGSEVRNIAAFGEQHEGCLRLVLDRSFRVPPEILEAALRVVSSGDLPGAAGPVKPAAGAGRVDAYIFDQETAEAEWIAQEIEHAVRAEGVLPGNIAILVRSKREMLNELSRALQRRDLPHDPPRRRLVDHPAIRLVNDLVTVAVQGGSARGVPPGQAAEADRAMRRVMLGPLFATSLGKERDLARRRRRLGLSWVDILEQEGVAASDLRGILVDNRWATSGPASEGFWHLWTSLGVFEAIAKHPDKDQWRLAFSSFAQALSRQADRDPSVSLARYFELTEEEDFEATPLISPTPHTDQITLTTLHQAKGLEFDHVFIANAVESVFPDLRRSRRMLRPELLSPERATNIGAQHLFQVQEEMRLAYTAMTRAKRRVVWTATDAGVDQGERRPSRFLIAAAGVTSIESLGAPKESQLDPVTVSEFEVSLRRKVLDPHAPAVARLAATQVLATAPGGWWEPDRFAGVPAFGPDAPLLPVSIRLSPSQAESYATCPRRYAMERRLRLGDSESPYARFGSLVHRVLEISESTILGTGATHADLATALDAIEEVWKDADFGTPQLNEAWKRHAIEGLTKLYDRWPGNGVPLALETRVETEIEGVAWVGLIDRLERTKDGLQVVDYKSGKSYPSVAAAAESIQLAFYATAANRVFGEAVRGAEMWFPRANSVGVTVRKLDIESLDQATAAMAEITLAILGEIWAPRVNERCGKCEFQTSCPAWPQGRGAYIS